MSQLNHSCNVIGLPYFRLALTATGCAFIWEASFCGFVSGTTAASEMGAASSTASGATVYLSSALEAPVLGYRAALTAVPRWSPVISVASVFEYASATSNAYSSASHFAWEAMYLSH